ncbi:MAG: PqqD family protein [Ignavibacteriales bacterium]|nr:PqqD family protein [Ignavibacteriales bacterium]
MSKKPASSINLLDLAPTRLVPWEETTDALVILLIPKFTHPWVAPWLLPRLKHPNLRVNLDVYGSFLWKRCDGVATLGAIVEEMKRSFPEDGDGLYKRTGVFVRRLVKEDCLAVPGVR